MEKWMLFGLKKRTTGTEALCVSEEYCGLLHLLNFFLLVTCHGYVLKTCQNVTNHSANRHNGSTFCTMFFFPFCFGNIITFLLFSLLLVNVRFWYIVVPHTVTDCCIKIVPFSHSKNILFTVDLTWLITSHALKPFLNPSVLLSIAALL